MVINGRVFAYRKRCHLHRLSEGAPHVYQRETFFSRRLASALGSKFYTRCRAESAVKSLCTIVARARSTEAFQGLYIVDFPRMVKYDHFRGARGLSKEVLHLLIVLRWDLFGGIKFVMSAPWHMDAKPSRSGLNWSTGGRPSCINTLCSS
jgi:hypothetical protein